MFVRDTAADVMKVVIVLCSGLSLVYGWSYLRERNLYWAVLDETESGLSPDPDPRTAPEEAAGNE